jgi:hypothetical protein
MQRIYPACAVLVATLLLASCSAINFAYNNAPGFVASEFDDAFHLDDAQKARLDDKLKQFFAWHRQHELTRYREFLDHAALTIGDGITAQEVLELGDSLRDTWRRSLAQAVDHLGGLAATLTPQQIESYQQYFREKSASYDDYLEMSKQQREIYRVKRGLERLQDWFGNFDELQRERISLRLQQLPDNDLAWIDYREARQQALLHALRAAPGEDLTSQLKFILMDPASEHARIYEPERSAYWQAYASMIEDISSNLLSKAQLRHAVERLRDYVEIVDYLEKQS